MTLTDVDNWDLCADESIHAIAESPFFETQQIRELYAIWADSCANWLHKKFELQSSELSGESVDWAGAYEMRKLEIDLLCNEFDLEMGRVNAEAAKKD